MKGIKKWTLWLLTVLLILCLTPTALAADPVASVTINGTTTNYDTMNGMIGAANAGTAASPATVKLLSNVDLGDMALDFYTSDGVISLDLNGYELTSTSYTMIVRNGVNVTVLDSSTGETGTIVSSTGDVGRSAACILIQNGSHVTLEGGTLSSATRGVAVKGDTSSFTMSGGAIEAGLEGLELSEGMPTATVSGGSITSTNSGIYSTDTSTLTITGSPTIESEYSCLALTDDSTADLTKANCAGWTITCDAEVWDVENPPIKLPDGMFPYLEEDDVRYWSTIPTDVVMTVGTPDTTARLTLNGGTPKDYPLLQQAFDAISEGDTATITLLQDTGMFFHSDLAPLHPISVPEGATVTLEGGGNDIASQGTSNALLNYGKLTLSNVTLAGKGDSFSCILNGGTLTMERGAAISVEGYSCVGIDNTGTVLLKDGNSICVNGEECKGVWNHENCSLTMEGGTISATTTGTKACGIYNEGGIVTVTGGAVSAKANLYAYGIHNISRIFGNETTPGTMTLSGGTISAEGRLSRGIVNECSLTLTGGTVSAEGSNCRGISNSGENTTLTMSGGTVSAVSGGSQNYCCGIDNYSSALIVTGGSISVEGNGADGIMNSDGNLTLAGGSISATGSGSRGVTHNVTDATDATQAICLSGSITASGEDCGIWVNAPLTLIGGLTGETPISIYCNYNDRPAVIAGDNYTIQRSDLAKLVASDSGKLLRLDSENNQIILIDAKCPELDAFVTDLTYTGNEDGTVTVQVTVTVTAISEVEGTVSLTTSNTGFTLPAAISLQGDRAVFDSFSVSLAGKALYTECYDLLKDLTVVFTPAYDSDYGRDQTDVSSPAKLYVKHASANKVIVNGFTLPLTETEDYTPVMFLMPGTPVTLTLPEAVAAGTSYFWVDPYSNLGFTWSTAETIAFNMPDGVDAYLDGGIAYPVTVTLDPSASGVTLSIDPDFARINSSYSGTLTLRGGALPASSGSVTVTVSGVSLTVDEQYTYELDSDDPSIAELWIQDTSVTGPITITVSDFHAHNPGTDGNCKVCGVLLEAKLTSGTGTTWYTSIQSALDAAMACTAADEAVVTLLADCESTSRLYASSGVYTLDLNGKTLTSRGLNVESDQSAVTAITLKNGTLSLGRNLYVYGGSLTVEGDAAITGSCVIELSGGELIVRGAADLSKVEEFSFEDGRIDLSAWTAAVEGLPISNGCYEYNDEGYKSLPITLSYTSESTDAQVILPQGMVIVEYVIDPDSFSITGYLEATTTMSADSVGFLHRHGDIIWKWDETYHWKGCSSCLSKEDTTNKAAHTLVNGKCTGCGAAYAVTVTSNGAETSYLTLEAALAAVENCTAENEAEVKLLADCTTDAMYGYEAIGGVFTLDLNGHTITGTGSYAALTVLADVTITGGTLEAPYGYAIAMFEGASVTLDDCIISAKDGVWVSKSELTVKDVEFNVVDLAIDTSGSESEPPILNLQEMPTIPGLPVDLDKDTIYTLPDAVNLYEDANGNQTLSQLYWVENGSLVIFSGASDEDKEAFTATLSSLSVCVAAYDEKDRMIAVQFVEDITAEGAVTVSGDTVKVFFLGAGYSPALPFLYA